MNRFSDFDHFLIDLARQIKTSPEPPEKVIKKAIKTSNCPYLKRKMEGYLGHLKAIN